MEINDYKRVAHEPMDDFYWEGNVVAVGMEVDLGVHSDYQDHEDHRHVNGNCGVDLVQVVPCCFYDARHS